MHRLIEPTAEHFAEHPNIYDDLAGSVAESGIVGLVAPQLSTQLATAYVLRPYRVIANDMIYSSVAPNAADKEWALEQTLNELGDEDPRTEAVCSLIGRFLTEAPSFGRPAIEQLSSLEPRNAISHLQNVRSKTDLQHDPSTVYASGLNLHLAMLRLQHRRLSGDSDGEPGEQTIEALAQEWRDYTVTALTIDAALWRSGLRKRQLSLRSGVELSVLLNEGRVPAARILSMFALQNAMFEYAYDYELRKSGGLLERYVPPAERVRNDRGEAVLKNQKYVDFLDAAQAGTILELEDISEVGDAVFAVAARIAEATSQTYGKAQHSVWGRNLNLDWAARLRPAKFHGKLAKVRVMRLPLDEDWVTDYVSQFSIPDEIDRTSLVRLGIVADMHSTGRGKVGETLAETVIYAKNPAAADERKVHVSVRGAASGKTIAEILNREAYGASMVQLIRALQAPYSGGLPSLGKR